jgi:hypothetical protein
MTSEYTTLSVKKIEITAVHADVNAAKNMLAAGLLAVSACGDDP